jgi:heme-degrading monooxygenase HmoA
MIARHWRGIAKTSRAAEYEKHLLTETFPALDKMHGFLGGGILKRTVENGVEFLVISRWASIEAIEQFAGPDVEAAVVPPKVQDMMLDYDQRARHYEFKEFKGR